MNSANILSNSVIRIASKTIDSLQDDTSIKLYADTVFGTDDQEHKGIFECLLVIKKSPRQNQRHILP